MGTVRWSIVVSADTDKALRVFLANRGGGRKGDLSRFVEEAVKTYILEQTVERIKKANADLPEVELAGLVDEALDWSRN
jgi:endo-1,4-beta-mannosidase